MTPANKNNADAAAAPVLEEIKWFPALKERKSIIKGFFFRRWRVSLYFQLALAWCQAISNRVRVCSGNRAANSPSFWKVGKPNLKISYQPMQLLIHFLFEFSLNKWKKKTLLLHPETLLIWKIFKLYKNQSSQISRHFTLHIHTLRQSCLFVSKEAAQCLLERKMHSI